MTELGPRNKGEMEYPFGGGDDTRATPVESFDDEVGLLVLTMAMVHWGCGLTILAE